VATTVALIFGAAMTGPTSVSQFRSEFDPFLYASVQERSDGPLLSVLSALARLDVDPWQEAEKLSQMSRDKAVWRMAALIETLPNDAAAHLNSKAIATRLIALLPRQIAISVRTSESTLPSRNFANMRAIMTIIILNVLFMAVSFGAQYLIGNRTPSTLSNQAHTPAISTLKPAVPAPYSGK
jgi:hypothetical protein